MYRGFVSLLRSLTRFVASSVPRVSPIIGRHIYHTVESELEAKWPHAEAPSAEFN